MTTRTMGRRPAVKGCRCRICLPHRPGEPPLAALDAIDRDCIDTVLRHGWQVMMVGGGRCSCCSGPDDPTIPPFAYTVGLTHRTGHPELAMSGQSAQLMHAVLNKVATHVVAGRRLRLGECIEGALPNAPLTVDRISGEGLQHIGLFSAWFHRRPAQALQLVWPTVSGVFAWQPGAPADLDERQPPEWRVQSARIGAFAADPPWPLPVPPDAMAIVCTHVCHDGEPIRLVARQPGVAGAEDWSFSCGRDHGEGIDELLTEHIAHTVRAAPSVRQVADLPMDGWAARADAFAPWIRGGG